MVSQNIKRFVKLVKSEKYTSAMLNEIDKNSMIPEELAIPEAGYNGLHIAVMIEDELLAMRLINEGTNIFKQGAIDGCTPLLLYGSQHPLYKHKSIHNVVGVLPMLPIVNALLWQQIKNKNVINPTCNLGVNHLHVACMFNHKEAVEMFLKSGENPNEATSIKYLRFPGWTPLHFAIQFSALETIIALLDHGADICLKDGSGSSPMQLLAERSLEMFRALKLASSPIGYPIVKQIHTLENIVYQIVGAKDKEIHITDHTGLSLLHISCAQLNGTMVQALLRRLPDVHKPVSDESTLFAGWTALHFAANYSVLIFQTIMKFGGDLTVKNKKGETPLDILMRTFKPSVVHYVLSTREQFRKILLTDNTTKLLDLLQIMDNCQKFNDFLKQLPDVNITVPHESPIWPGCSILHLAILMNDKNKDPNDYIQKLINETTETRFISSAEDKDKLYWRRIIVCLVNNCRIALKNADGLTPIHLAFRLGNQTAVDKLLNSCHTNEIDDHGLSILHIVCAIGSKNIPRCLLMNVDICTKNYMKIIRDGYGISVPMDSTPLHVAVCLDNYNVVDFLLHHNANACAVNSMGFTPIHLAITLPVANIARLLFAKSENIHEVARDDGLSHLHVAALADADTVIEKLIENGADINAKYKINDTKKDIPLYGKHSGETPLHIAVSLSHVKSIGVLITAGADIYAGHDNSESDTPLRRALQNRNPEVIAEFAKKLRREKRTKGPILGCGPRLLHVACATFDYKWMENLLDKGSDPNALLCVNKKCSCDMTGFTPLHLLVKRVYYSKDKVPNLMKMIRLLLKYDADVTLQTHVHGWTPALLAERLANAIILRDTDDIDHKFPCTEKCSKNKKSMDGKLQHISEVLLENQKIHTINPVSRDGMSHFHYACIINNVEIVQKFLNNGVDINLKRDPNFLNDSFTPLHMSLACCSYEVIDLLLDHNADVNARTFLYEETPLHFAGRYDCRSKYLIKRFLRMGADINAKNIAGQTPFDLFIAHGDVTYEMLLFYLSLGYTINFSKRESDKGVIGLLMSQRRRKDREQILRLLFDKYDLCKHIKNGFNAIQSFISIPQDLTLWSTERFIGGIKFFLALGCDINAVNEEGTTAVKQALLHCNSQALEALMFYGADIDLNLEQILVALPPWSRKSRKIEQSAMIDLTSMHNLKVNIINKRRDETTWEWEKSLTALSNEWRGEFKTMSEIKFCDKYSLLEFLGHSQYVKNYKYLSSKDRRQVDDFFGNYDVMIKRFPHFCSPMMMLYRRAVREFKKKNGISLTNFNDKLPEDFRKLLQKFMKSLHINDDVTIQRMREEQKANEARYGTRH